MIGYESPGQPQKSEMANMIDYHPCGCEVTSIKTLSKL